MDISSISNNSNNQYMSFFKTQSAMNKAQNGITNLNENIKKVTTNSPNKGSAASNIIMAQKGQAGYMKEMDSDGDGKVTLEEFNKYCEENDIEGKAKLMLMTSMQVAKSSEQLLEETKARESKKSEEDTSSKDDERIYAQQGDEKYTSAMDKNGNGIITYEEYQEFINGKDKDETASSTSDSSEDETDIEEYTIEPEVQSTVEYEV